MKDEATRTKTPIILSDFHVELEAIKKISSIGSLAGGLYYLLGAVKIQNIIGHPLKSAYFLPIYLQRSSSVKPPFAFLSNWKLIDPDQVVSSVADVAASMLHLPLTSARSFFAEGGILAVE